MMHNETFRSAQGDTVRTVILSRSEAEAKNLLRMLRPFARLGRAQGDILVANPTYRKGYPTINCGVSSVIRGDRGQIALPLAILAFTFAVLVGIPLLHYVSTVFLAQLQVQDRALKIYAAEAGMNRVIADMVRGADAVPTTYVTTEPHKAGQPYDTFTITTYYTLPSVTVNEYTPIVTIATPSDAQEKPSTQQNYVDPGVANPDLKTIPYSYSYLMRLYNVYSGTIQVNWAYSPASISRVGVWAGIPVAPDTAPPYTPGRISGWPLEQPILDTGFSPATATYNRTGAINVGPGVYTIVFDNSRGNQSKTTSPFQPTGGPDDTWIYVNAQKDYVITSTVSGVTVTAYLRQVPGFAEPPVWSSGWSSSNISWITNTVYRYSWNPP